MRIPYSIMLQPVELEDQFRLEALPRHKSRMLAVLIISSIFHVGFIFLDFYRLHDSSSFLISIVSRIVVSLFFLGGLWRLTRPINVKDFDLIFLILYVVLVIQMLIINFAAPGE